MGTVYKKMYVLINQNLLYFEQYSSKDLSEVIHEYLAILCEYVYLVKSCGGNPENSDYLNKIFIVKKEKINSRTPYWITRWSYDFKTQDIDTPYVKTNVIQEQLSNLRKSLTIPKKEQVVILKTNKTHVVTPKVNPPENPSSLSLDDIGEKIKELEKQKELEAKELEDLRRTQKEKDELVANVNSELSYQKNKIKIEKERLEEKKRIFECDKNVYNKIKQQIIDEKIQEHQVPILFAPKYPIFKIMDEKNELDKENDFSIYLDYCDSLKEPIQNAKKVFIPHNINYLPEEERKKYEENTKHTIDEQLAYNNNKQKYIEYKNTPNAIIPKEFDTIYFIFKVMDDTGNLTTIIDNMFDIDNEMNEFNKTMEEYYNSL